MENSKPTYNLKEMVDFGNYLLSKKRQDRLINKNNKDVVWDADLANWHEDMNMISKYLVKKGKQ